MSLSKCHTFFSPRWLLAAFACKIKAERGEGGGGGVFLRASECERLSGNSRGTGHMSLLSLQAETAITGRLVAHLKCRTVAAAAITRKKEKRGVWVGMRITTGPTANTLQSVIQTASTHTHTHTHTVRHNMLYLKHTDTTAFLL